MQEEPLTPEEVAQRTALPTIEELERLYEDYAAKAEKARADETQRKSAKTRWENGGRRDAAAKTRYHERAATAADSNRVAEAASNAFDAAYNRLSETLPKPARRILWTYRGTPVDKMRSALAWSPLYEEKRETKWYAFYAILDPDLDHDLMGVHRATAVEDVEGYREAYRRQARLLGFPEADVYYREVERGWQIRTIIEVLTN